MNSKPTLTDHLKALLLGGALAMSSTHSAPAAPVQPSSQDADSLDARVQKVRDQLRQNTNFRTGNGPAADGSNLMWWRNAWGNGGWHNWHNGWGNFGGGWRNWHNW